MPYSHFSSFWSKKFFSLEPPNTPRWTAVGAATITAASLLSAALPLSPAEAIELRFNRSRNAYRVCAQQMVKVGVVPEAAAAACAAALHPRDISSCVSQINSKTKVAPMDALFNCRRVRRPDELATCVVDINSKAQGAPIVSVIDHCRRSLLPERFSDCVVGLSRQLKFPTEQLLATCIDARYQIGQFEPNAVPPVTAPVQPTPLPSPQ
ncbi:MAG TPA: hypothetical protein VK211_16600 [Kamptonema sp.]|nr:hypothetical protein [Kamptonema sp.]